jgi:hypothetical protein
MSVAKAIGSVPEIPLASMVKVGIKFTVPQTGVSRTVLSVGRFALIEGTERMDRLYLGVITVASTYTLVSTALLTLVFMR